MPAALSLNLKHNGVVHEQVVLLKVTTDRAPRVSEVAAGPVEELPMGSVRGDALWLCREAGCAGGVGRASGEIGCDPATASFFLGREVPVPLCGRSCRGGRNGSTPSWCATLSAHRITS